MARAIYGHPKWVGEIWYMSRQVNDRMAVVLFEPDPKDPHGLKQSSRIGLNVHSEFAATVNQLTISSQSAVFNQLYSISGIQSAGGALNRSGVSWDISDSSWQLDILAERIGQLDHWLFMTNYC